MINSISSLEMVKKIQYTASPPALVDHLCHLDKGTLNFQKKIFQLLIMDDIILEAGTMFFRNILEMHC